MKEETQEFNNLDEVVESLLSEVTYKERQIPGDVSQEEFTRMLSEQHHGAGTSIRNHLHLWWQKDWIKKYGMQKPKLVQWFNDLNIYHADDMSGTIQAAMQAKLKGETFDIKKHLKIYFKHWKELGFKDGIFINR